MSHALSVVSVPVEARSQSEAAAAAAVPRRGLNVFWWSFWLAAVLAGIKGVCLFLAPDYFDGTWTQHVKDLGVAIAADVAFACAAGITGKIFLLLTRRSRRLSHAATALLVFFYLAAVLYTIANLPVLMYMGSPLTKSLILLAGDLSNMKSSIGSFVTVPMVAGLVGTTLLYAVLAIVSSRLTRRLKKRRTRSPWVGRLGMVAMFALVAGYLIWARRSYATHWQQRIDRYVADNPQYALVASYLLAPREVDAAPIHGYFPPPFLDDFKIVAERQSPPALSPINGPRPKNVILITLESVPTRYLSVYGCKYPTTPNLQREMQHTLRLNNFYSHVESTANAMVITCLSMYPGCRDGQPTYARPNLPGTSLADVLGPRGYRTAFIASCDLNFVGEARFLANRGFDKVWDYREVGHGTHPFSWGVEDRYTFDAMIKWIDEDRTRPFFAWCWTIQTHHPYLVAPADQAVDFFHGNLPTDADDLGKYLNALLEADRQIGRLLAALRERGIADDTLVVITGDHGDCFGPPHNTYMHSGYVYQEDVNVPMILWNPRLYHGETSEAIGGHVDINPTILDLLGIERVPRVWQGRSLLDPDRPQRAYFYGLKHEIMGVRDGNWKYVYDPTLHRAELYDLPRDPEEQLNVAAKHQDTCQILHQRLAAWGDYESKHLARLPSVRPDVELLRDK